MKSKNYIYLQVESICNKNMRIHLKNLGPLKDAEFELGEFTIICGDNNNGKGFKMGSKRVRKGVENGSKRGRKGVQNGSKRLKIGSKP